MIKGVTTGQIYWGAVPFVLIQVVMIALVIAFPQMVMVYKAGERKFDIEKIQIIVPEEQPVFPPDAAKGTQGPLSGGAQQEAAEKALERAFGGGGTDAPGAATPDAPGAGATDAAPGGAPGADEQDDDQKALERALREQMGEPSKDAPKQ